ncbi:Cof-type HAD-IIB family hydrolase [Tundrisphaera sp. TA3]|uniref:Cof-type HAD-IIB family hydrolase n=1 Tax=Tundrisphaera sp. TA3 TaxID=3435775 RepID=UPI003EB84101
MDRIKLVAIDLDGTLLNGEHRISRANAGAIAACRAAGVGVMIASGRTWSSVGPYCKELGLTGPQITLNGGAIVEAPEGTIEAGTLMPEEILRSITDHLQALRLPFVIFGGKAIYALPGTAEAAELESFGEPAATIVTALDRDHLPDPIKILVFSPDAEDDGKLIALAGGRTDTVRTHARFFEYVMPGVTKGTALAEVIARKGLPRRSVMAVGDYYNDLGLFAAAGVSVAMGGAPEEVRAAADFVTATCEEDGLARALEVHVLGKSSRRYEEAAR